MAPKLDTLLEILDALPLDVRQSRLAALCQEFPNLADALRARLKQIEGVDSVLQIGPAPLPEIEGLERVKEIGQGGMGRVYRAYDKELGRHVAVKTPRAATLAKSEAAGFRREARILANLRHPNIVALHYARLVDRTPYFVMEYVEAGTLADQRDKFSEPVEAVRIVEEIALGLQFAHEHDVLHLDLKPTNILVRKDGGVLVSDFGIANWIDSTRRDPDSHSFSWHYTTGTAAAFAALETGAGSRYVAPERTTEGTTIAASDVWALGRILEYLLTADSPSASAIPHKARGLQPIIDKCCHLDTDKRYDTARQVADALSRWRRKREGRKLRRLVFAATVCVALSAAAWFCESRWDLIYRVRASLMVNSLLERRELELIDEHGEWRIHRVLSNPLAHHSKDQEGNRLFSQDLTLIELLPTVPAAEVEVTCQVKDLGSHKENDGGVGVYLAGEEEIAGMLTFAALSFSESTDWILTEDGSKAAKLAWMQYQPPGPPIDYLQSFALGREPYEVTGGWHDLRIRATRNRIQAWLDGRVIADIPFASKVESRQAFNKSLGIASANPTKFQRGSIGILVYESEAAFRNFVVRVK